MWDQVEVITQGRPSSARARGRTACSSWVRLSHACRRARANITSASRTSKFRRQHRVHIDPVADTESSESNGIGHSSRRQPGALTRGIVCASGRGGRELTRRAADLAHPLGHSSRRRRDDFAVRLRPRAMTLLAAVLAGLSDRPRRHGAFPALRLSERPSSRDGRGDHDAVEVIVP